jgi:hypothetical protein
MIDRGAPGMRRFLVLLTLIFSLVLAACRDDDSGGGGNGDNGKDHDDENTFIVFDNSAGLYPVSVYESGTREGKITEVAARAASAAIPWRANPGYTFYIAYTVFIDDVPVTYIPRPGADHLLYRIDAGLTTTITLPPLSTTLDSAETPLSDASYIAIQNTSYGSCYLLRGSRIITPDNVPDSYIVNGGEKALYRFSTPGTAAEYKLFSGGVNIDFPVVEGDFQEGYVYTFVFSGANLGETGFSLKSDTAIRLSNISVEQGLNAGYSFTTWRDRKVDAETGETVPGDNAVIFYADSAKLSGSYWEHPGGDFNYNGQILESYFDSYNGGVVVWTLKSEGTGYLLKPQPDQTLQAFGSSAHPFYKN